MNNCRNLRASDADRARTVEVLQREVGTGRLTVDEFSERAAAAYAARTVGELAGLTRDLPRTAPDGPPPEGHHRVPVLFPLVLLLALTLTLTLSLLALAGIPAMAALGEVPWCH